jgi:hypothetical protein
VLLYRPLISAYRRSGDRAGRRFILREFASPELHSEPEELLAMLDGSDLALTDDPARLFAHVALAERALKLRLTARDATRQLGGLWTRQVTRDEARGEVRWCLPAPALARAAGDRLGDAALALVRGATGSSRALALVGLGELGKEVALEPLARELATGDMPEPAALALASLPDDAAHEALVPAVQERGLERAAGWLALALARVPSARSCQLVARLAKSSVQEAREHAAWALGAMPAEDATPLVELFDGEKSAHVRLNLVRSIGRLGVPGGRDTLRKQYAPKDPELLRVAVIQAAGRSTAAVMTPFLERMLENGRPEEKAAALQSLVRLRVPGAPYAKAARTLAENPDGRIALPALLALATWAPEEAYGVVRGVFSAPAGGPWFLAAYALRYLNTDQTVPLLARLCKTARGSDLEEIAVSALCRHLEEPLTLDLLLACVKPDTSPPVVERIMADLAHHLPEERAAEAAEKLRALVKGGGPHAGPALVALGALGTADDMKTIAPFLKGACARQAVQALALLSEPAAAELLEPLAERATPEGEAALVTLFQLGGASCEGHLSRWAARGESTPAACRAVFEMGLSIRAAASMPRLAALLAALSEHAKTLSVTDAPVPVSAARRSQKVESVPRRAKVSGTLPALSGAPPPGSGEMVYSDLARHLQSLALHRPRPERVKVMTAAVVTLVVMLAGISWRNAGRAADEARERSRRDRTPALYRADVPAEAGVVPDGEVVEGRPGAPVTLATRMRENELTISGRVKIVGVRFARESTPAAELEVTLQDGGVEARFPRGMARIVVPSARTTVEVLDGKARVDAVPDRGTVRVAVLSGKARVLRGPVPRELVRAGGAGEFRDGSPVVER